MYKKECAAKKPPAVPEIRIDTGEEDIAGEGANSTQN